MKINSTSKTSSTKFCPLYFPTKILGLVDTGAAKSLISEEQYNKLPQDAIIKETHPKTKLYGVKGHPLKVVKTATIKFKIGNKSLQHTFQVIGQFGYKLLLGIDFLTSHKVKVNFENCTLVINNQVIFLKDSEGKHDNKLGVVKSFTKTVIEPMTVTLIKVSSKQKHKGNCLITPLLNSELFWEQPGLTSACSLVKSNKGLYLPVYNETSKRFCIRKGQVIGIIEEIDENTIIKQDEKQVKNTIIKQDEQQQENCINEVNLEQDFQSKSSSRVNCNENKLLTNEGVKKKFEELLEKYDCIFAKDETDLGTTHLMEASFDTGNALPIKQRPYRLPFSQWPVLENHLKELSNAGIIEPSQSPWS